MARKSIMFVGSPTYDTLSDVGADMLRVQDAFNNLSLYSATEESHESPAKVINLQVVYADGVNWNPGKGEGLYIRIGTQWKKFNLE